MSEIIQIKNGILDLFASGSLIFDSTDQTIIKLTAEGDQMPLNIILKFENEEKDANLPRKAGNIVDATTLEIVFTNYNNSLGAFNKDFWELGSLSKRKLYFVYVIYGFSETKLKKIDYSFYLGEEVANG